MKLRLNKDELKTAVITPNGPEKIPILIRLYANLQDDVKLTS